MTNIPDYRGRIESDQPQDVFHKIASKIPGYAGYQDKERRRDADKELRMYLARRFRDQHAELTRVQQQLARSGHLQQIAEVDRLGGVLQRFIDKLETASQGYAGLFDPIKVDAAALDQLYTFDSSLTDGLQQVTDAVESVASAGQQSSSAAPELPAALTRLSTTLDALLRTWNHRNEVIMSGRPIATEDFNKFRTSQGAPSGPQPYQPPPGPAGGASAPPYQPPAAPPSPPAGPQAYQPYAGPSAPPAGPQAYQPYAGPSAPPTGSGAPEEGATRRLDPLQSSPGLAGTQHPSDTSGHPTGGPTDSGTPGSGQ